MTATREPISLRVLDRTLRTRAARATASVFKTHPRILGRALESKLEEAANDTHGLIGGPVFEATFPWKTGRETLGDLSGGLLDRQLVQALDSPPGDLYEHRFPLDRRPYLHQLEAWEALTGTGRRSAVISSGTGSGKTECFLIPVLQDLVSQLQGARPLIGVQALFLYPLNALINNQRDRLRAWTEPFGKRLRFCLYNGETPTNVPSDKQHQTPSQILSRKLLRDEPPPILVTNATMLEYMLVRHGDQPILKASRKRLRWIILDEAHTYLGSQAAEIALLLRRVLHAFDVEPSEVCVVATSATIGDNSPPTRTKLAEFIADLAGTSRGRVSVIMGQREIPNLPDFGPTDKQPRTIKDFRELPASQRFRHLTLDPRARHLRDLLAEKPRTADQLLNNLRPSPGGDSLQRGELLDFFDFASAALPADGSQRHIPFLPVRAHFFHRTLIGLWACTDPGCRGRATHGLEDPDWALGGIFFEPRERCPDCQSLVLEVTLCAACGEVHLRCQEDYRDGTSFLQPAEREGDDEADDLLVPLEPMETDEEEASEAFERPSLTALRLAIPGREETTDSWTARFDAVSGEVDARDSLRLLKLTLVNAGEDGIFRCTRCRERNSAYRGRLFRPFRLGANFYLFVSIPALLENTPPLDRKAKDHPSGGRRLLTFSDSRQGTARFSLRVQLEAERTHVRSLLIHSLAAQRQLATQDPSQIEQLRQEIAALEPGARTNDVIARLVETKRQELREALEPSAGRMGWDEAVTALFSSQSVRSWISHAWKELSWGQLKDRNLAEYLLLREVFRRPRQRSSVETLGLVALEYPNLRPLHQLPLSWTRKDLDQEDWRNFQHILLDFLVRSRSAVMTPPHFLAWMDSPIRQSFVVGPETQDLSKSQWRWPSSRFRGFKRSRAVRFLAELLLLDVQSSTDREEIDIVLAAAWDSLRSVLTPHHDGFQLDFRKDVELSEPQQLFRCPVTRQALSRTVGGITPYLPSDLLPEMGRELTRAEGVQPVRIPVPHWRDPRGREWSSAEVLEWLETDPRVCAQREAGLWTETADRIVARAPYFRAVEHSAQQDSSLLRLYETRFRAGDVNVLSCSTTMEMGVDIGGLSAVAMNNAPPGPANFLQRAGRAGRRGEGVAVSLTLCGGTPHAEEVFRRPDWPFTTRLYVPTVSLQSDRIVRRHLGAFLLSEFLFLNELDPPSLNTSWFFEGDDDGPSPEARFGTWLRRKRTALRHSLATGLRRLVQGTGLSGVALQELLEQIADELSAISARWRTEVEALEQQLEDMGPRQEGKATPAHVALDRQLERLRGEYLLGELASQGFLPGYGFPTRLVPFISTTKDQLDRDKQTWRQRGSRWEDRTTRRRGYPSRELSIAIREFAPGNQLVLDGRVFTSGGVTLNWHIPAGDREAVRELQAFRTVWRCKVCGSTGSRSRRPKRCSACENDDPKKLTIHGYLQPAGFAVDFTHPPRLHLDPALYVPVEDPWITAGETPWQFLPDPQFGRFRSSRYGHIFHYSRGLHRRGFAICLRCGRADSEAQGPGGELPKSMVNHRRLRGGRKSGGGDSACSGNLAQFAVRRHEWLGIASQTDVFEIQLLPFDLLSTPTLAAAYSVAAALRDSLAEHLGIDSRELGCSAVASRIVSGHAGWSAVVFDRTAGGAGFSSSAPEHLPELLRAAAQRLCCPRACEGACQSCLLSYDTQYNFAHLDRRAALELISDGLLESLKLKADRALFGPGSALELATLPDALLREAQSRGFEDLRLYLGGSGASWDVEDWNLRPALLRWAAEGRRIQVFIASESKASATSGAGTYLAHLASLAEIELLESPGGDAWRQGAGYRIAEMIAPGRFVRWGVLSPRALQPGPEWGTSDDLGTLIRHAGAEVTSPPKSTLLAAETLRSAVPSGSARILILDQLDGRVTSFGQRFWERIREQSSTLRSWIVAPTPVERITYQDRFLHSPLVVRLFISVLKELDHLGLVGPKTKLDILTSSPNRPRYRPSKFYNNWEESEQIEAVFNASVGKLFRGGFRLRVQPRPKTPHHRQLELKRGSGPDFTCTLDQGFGYWRIPKRQKTRFPFDQATELQIAELSRARFIVKGASDHFSTYLFVSP